MILKLPYPPTANHYWRHTNTGKHYIAKAGREYRLAVYVAARKAGVRHPDMRRLGVTIEATMPDKRRRDIDNLLKALLDALTHALVWHDDEQIDRLTIRRAGIAKGGGVTVTIEGAA